MRIPTFGVLALALAACGGPSNQLPVKTVAVTFDPKANKYQLNQVELTTIADLETMKGTVANIQGGAEIVLDANTTISSGESNDQIRAAVVRDPGGDVRASFVTSGDVQYPVDFHSENMVTTYYNFERAYQFYSQFGWTVDAGAPIPNVYYWASYTDTSISATPLQDNAAFFSVAGGFLILPFNQLQDIPLPMNLGIIGHEYSHFMVNTRVYDQQAVPQFLVDYGAFETGSPTPQANILKSLDEGFADLFGTGVTCGPTFENCDPDFIAASIASQSDARRLDTVHCIDGTLYSEMVNDNLGDFLAGAHEYELGTVLSSAVWHASTDHDVVQAFGSQGQAYFAAAAAVYASLDDPGGLGLKQVLIQDEPTPSRFRLDNDVVDLVVTHASEPHLKAALCAAFQDRVGTAADKAFCQQNCTADVDETATELVGDVTYGCICACRNVPYTVSEECLLQADGGLPQ